MPNLKLVRLGRWFSVLCACLTLAMAQNVAAKLPLGSGQYQFTGWDGPPLRIQTYIPQGATAETPIIIVMHGVNRDADRYRDEWIDVADRLQLIVAAPEFDEKRFPKSTNYNLGGLGSDTAFKSTSAFAAIEPLFDDLKLQTGSQKEKYFLYGHSAGAQFVHRFVFAHPTARLEKAFVANAGWYTMVSAGIAFPYGLKGSGLSAGTQRTAMQAPLVILLGDADIEPGGNLRDTDEANAQGYNRLQRGLTFFSHAATLAGQKKMPFVWRLSIVPGAAHENHKMAWGVAPFIAGVASSPAKAD